MLRRRDAREVHAAAQLQVPVRPVGAAELHRLPGERVPLAHAHVGAARELLVRARQGPGALDLEVAQLFRPQQLARRHAPQGKPPDRLGIFRVYRSLFTIDARFFEFQSLILQCAKFSGLNTNKPIIWTETCPRFLRTHLHGITLELDMALAPLALVILTGVP